MRRCHLRAGARRRVQSSPRPRAGALLRTAEKIAQIGQQIAHNVSVATAPTAGPGDDPGADDHADASGASDAVSGAQPVDDAAAVKAAVEDIKARRISLVLLVTLGTVVVISIGGALFLWLAWLLSHQAAPWRDAAGWAWMAHIDGQGWFDSARTTATILAIVGVGGAALVAYRRQDTAELNHRFTVKAHETTIKPRRRPSRRSKRRLSRHTQRPNSWRWTRRSTTLRSNATSWRLTAARMTVSGSYAHGSPQLQSSSAVRLRSGWQAPTPWRRWPMTGTVSARTANARCA